MRSSFPEKRSRRLDAWRSEIDSYGVGADNTFTDLGYYSFANMVYSKSTQIGCAHKDCGTALQVYCLYDRIGALTDLCGALVDHAKTTMNAQSFLDQAVKKDSV